MLSSSSWSWTCSGFFRAEVTFNTARKNPEHVQLQLELDNTDLDTLPAHADEVRLSPDQAREVAAALEDHAADVEAAED